MFIANAQKRRMLFNIEQIKNNATHYTHIMKEYTRDFTIIVSNTFTNIGVKSRLNINSLMKWAAFPGFAKKIIKIMIIIIIIIVIIILIIIIIIMIIIIIIVIIQSCSQRWNQSQFYI